MMVLEAFICNAESLVSLTVRSINRQDHFLLNLVHLTNLEHIELRYEHYVDHHPSETLDLLSLPKSCKSLALVNMDMDLNSCLAFLGDSDTLLDVAVRGYSTSSAIFSAISRCSNIELLFAEGLDAYNIDLTNLLNSLTNLQHLRFSYVRNSEIILDAIQKSYLRKLKTLELTCNNYGSSFKYDTHCSDGDEDDVTRDIINDKMVSSIKTLFDNGLSCNLDEETKTRPSIVINMATATVAREKWDQWWKSSEEQDISEESTDEDEPRHQIVRLL
jgi:hypothetical protein